LKMGLTGLLPYLILCLSQGAFASQVAKPLVIVSVEPVALIVREVCGDQCEVMTLVPRGVSEHGWQPGPKDIVKAKDAQAAIGVGLGFDEKWLKTLAVSPKKILWVGTLLDPMGWWSDDMTGSFQGQNLRSKDAKRDRHHHHHHDKKNDEDHHDQLTKDPHVWTDAGRMSKAAELTAEHLATLLPDAAAGLKDRGRGVSQRLIKLQLSVETRRQQWRTRPVVVFHDVAGYFARRFNLPVLSVATGSSGHDLSAKMIAEVSRRFKDAHVAAVMVEREDGAAKSLARELKTSIKLVDFSAATSFKNWDEWYLRMVQAWEDVLKPVGSP
jgi:zinc transport system substrate-binding protein